MEWAEWTDSPETHKFASLEKTVMPQRVLQKYPKVSETLRDIYFFSQNFFREFPLSSQDQNGQPVKPSGGGGGGG